MAKTRPLCICRTALSVCRIGTGHFCRECASEAHQTAPMPLAPNPTGVTLYDVALAIATAKAASAAIS